MGWGHGNLGGGSSGLNIRFRTGTVEQRPDTGKQNDLFIVSDIPVRRYILSSGTPYGMQEGTYWLKISDHGENMIDMLDKNDLLLRLESVSLYQGGKLEKCQAFLWYNGVWIEYRKDLVIFESESGTQASKIFTVDDTNTVIEPDSSGLLVFKSLGEGRSNNVKTSIGYDLTPFSVMRIRVSTTNRNYPNSEIAKWHSVQVINASGMLASATIPGNALEWVEIPIKTINQVCHVLIKSYMGKETGYRCKCSDIWME